MMLQNTLYLCDFFQLKQLLDFVFNGLKTSTDCAIGYVREKISDMRIVNRALNVYLP